MSYTLLDKIVKSSGGKTICSQALNLSALLSFSASRSAPGWGESVVRE